MAIDERSSEEASMYLAAGADREGSVPCRDDVNNETDEGALSIMDISPRRRVCFEESTD